MVVTPHAEEIRSCIVSVGQVKLKASFSVRCWSILDKCVQRGQMVRERSKGSLCRMGKTRVVVDKRPKTQQEWQSSFCNLVLWKLHHDYSTWIILWWWSSCSQLDRPAAAISLPGPCCNTTHSFGGGRHKICFFYLKKKTNSSQPSPYSLIERGNLKIPSYTCIYK